MIKYQHYLNPNVYIYIYIYIYTLNNTIICPSHSSKYIGLLCDDKLSFKNHILSITKFSNFHLFRNKKYGSYFTETLLNL